jgi:predicted flap endonuclease-1-like 5' DNA nuclease
MGSPREFPSVVVASERAAQAWRLPLGAASPLWLVFGAATGAGVAFWWLSQWTRAVNVEALAGVKMVPAPEPAAPLEIIAEPEPPTADPLAEAIVADQRTDVEVVVAAEPETPAAVAEPPAADDLTRMVGIGPKLCAALAERGVTRFADIAAWTLTDLAEVDASLSLKGRAVRDAGVAQARRLAADA